MIGASHRVCFLHWTLCDVIRNENPRIPWDFVVPEVQFLSFVICRQLNKRSVYSLIDFGVHGIVYTVTTHVELSVGNQWWESKKKPKQINTRLATNEIFYLHNIFTKSNSGLLQKSGYNWINLANNVEGW